MTSTAVASPGLQRHFADMEQQVDAGKIGMWLFLTTEILLFGGLFAGFAIMQSLHREAFTAAHHHLDRSLGVLNTVALLVSSFTMVMAVHSSRQGRRRKLIVFLLLTLLCAGPSAATFPLSTTRRSTWWGSTGTWWT